MNITTLQLNTINPAEYNPRSITKDEFEGLKTSLQTFGQQENLIVNKDMTLISGHQRLQAMLALGWTEAVCNVVDLDKHEEKKLNVIMNSQAISGQWDDLKLAEILEELKLDDDYEALRLNELEPLDLSPTEVEEDEAPEVDESEPPKSKLGEIYQLGRHRVMCGSATDLDAVTVLADGNMADLILTDPPYNMAYTGSATARREAIINDKIDNFGGFVNDFIASMVAVAKSSAPYYVFTSEPEVGTIKKGFISNGLKPSQTIIWKKHRIGFGGADYQHQYEPLVYGWKSHKERYMVDKRNLSDVWEFSRPHKSEEHPTMKPIELLAYALHNSSKSDDIVLDLFLGSGSTLIACEQTDRTCYGMELDPKYVDIIRKRYWKFVNGSEEGWEDGTTNRND